MRKQLSVCVAGLLAAGAIALPAQGAAAAPGRDAPGGAAQRANICGYDWSFSPPGGKDRKTGQTRMPQTIAAIKATGCEFVIRYIDAPGKSTKKAITPAELSSLRAAGIKVVLVYEYYARRAWGGWRAAVADVNRVNAGLAWLGLPRNTVVYAAVDFDVDTKIKKGGYDERTWRYVAPYLRRWAELRGAAYTGVYGSVRVVRAAREAGVARYGWATYAWKYNSPWPDGDIAQLRQVKNGILLSPGRVDLNYAMSRDYGQIGGVEGGGGGGFGELPAPPAQPAATGGTVTVRQGDTLAKIAARHGTTWRAVWSVNRWIRNPNRIRVGWRIVIPGEAPAATTGRTLTVRPGDTLVGLAPRCGASWRALWAANRGAVPSPRRMRVGTRLACPR